MNCDFDEATDVTFVLHSINNILMRSTLQQAKKYGIDNCTIMHGWILGFLCENKKIDVYQRDIEREFSVTRSAVTAIVKSIETNGYIKRVEVEHDARLKKLIITPEGEAMHKKIIEIFKKINNDVMQGVPDDEYKNFLNVCTILKGNLSKISE